MWLNTALAQMISENCILLIRQVPYNLSVLLCSPSGGLFFQLAVLHIFWVKKNVPKGRGGRPTCFSQCSPPTAWFLAMLLVENHFKSFLLLFFFYSFKNIQQKKHQEAATHQPHLCHSCWTLILQAQNCGHSSEDNINSHNVQLSVGSINQFSFPGCHIPMFCHTPPHRSAVVLKNQSNCSKEISLVPKSYLRSYLLE